MIDLKEKISQLSQITGSFVDSWINAKWEERWHEKNTEDTSNEDENLAQFLDKAEHAIILQEILDSILSFRGLKTYNDLQVEFQEEIMERRLQCKLMPKFLIISQRQYEYLLKDFKKYVKNEIPDCKCIERFNICGAMVEIIRSNESVNRERMNKLEALGED